MSDRDCRLPGRRNKGVSLIGQPTERQSILATANLFEPLPPTHIAWDGGDQRILGKFLEQRVVDDYGRDRNFACSHSANNDDRISESAAVQGGCDLQ